MSVEIRRVTFERGGAPRTEFLKQSFHRHLDSNPGLRVRNSHFPPRVLITFTRLKKIRRHLDSNSDRSRQTSSTRLKAAYCVFKE